MELTLKLTVALITLGLASTAPNFKELDKDKFFSSPTELAGNGLKKWIKSKNRKGNAEEQSGYFEGDLILSFEALNGIISTSKQWESKTIPFVISGTFNTRERRLIFNAIKLFMQKTCLKFVQRVKENDYVVFKNGLTGCHSTVGRAGGAQVLNLQSGGCTTKIGTVIHEIFHALGFYHEQNRYDRDDYVKIKSENIVKGMESNFIKISDGSVSDYGVEYDYDSVLHYSAYAFSKNNGKTIEALGDAFNNDRIGQRVGFSQGDVDKINAMYCT